MGSLKDVERLFSELNRPVDETLALAEMARFADRLTSQRYRRNVGLET